MSDSVFKKCHIRFGYGILYVEKRTLICSTTRRVSQWNLELQSISSNLPRKLR